MKRAVLAVLALASISCGDMVRQGTGSSYLILTLIEAASGAEPERFGGTLTSDVLTIVDDASTIFSDFGRADFRLALKDPGPPENPNAPSPNNYITIDRYRVAFTRADGRNVQGVDVPYAFDGAVTVTVVDEASIGFVLVRHQAKMEAPLAALRTGGGLISTIADITFYGRDQTGREVSVTGRISVNFGNFADPDS